MPLKKKKKSQIMQKQHQMLYFEISECISVPSIVGVIFPQLLTF